VNEKVRAARHARSAERPLWAATGASLGLLLFAWLMLRGHHHPRGEVDVMEALRIGAGLVACVGGGWLPFTWAARWIEAAWAGRQARREARQAKETGRLETLFQYPGAASAVSETNRRRLDELSEQLSALAAEARGNSLMTRQLVNTFSDILPDYGHEVPGLEETKPMPLRLVKDSGEEKDSA
jgi:hypothetical protein